MLQKLITLVIASLLLFSCAAPLKIVKPFEQNVEKPLKQIALFPVLIGNLKKPTFPLIDAGIFNKKPNDRALQIIDMETTVIDSIQKDAAQILTNLLKTKVIYGADLQQLKNYQKLQKERNYKENLITNDSKFPTILMASGGINPFRFTDGKVSLFFKDANRYKGLINYLCKELDVDGIAVSYSHLQLNNVQVLGSFAKLNMYTHFYLFDSNGVLRAESSATTEGFNVKGKDIKEYELALNDFSALFDKMIKKLIQTSKY